MPRNYKKQLASRAYKNYSEETLQNTLQAIQGGLGIREASRRYGIEPSTLSRKRRNLFPRNPGRQPVFSKEEENILLAAQWGFPLTAYDIRLIVKQYLDRKGIKEERFGKDNMPGSDWARYFLNRHKSKLSARLCENIKRSRADDVNDEATNPKPSTSQETSDTSLSDNYMSVHDSDSDQGKEYNQELNNYNEGDYILVEFAPQTKRHQAVMYVGRVQEILCDKSDTLLYCKFLRTMIGKKMPKNSFKYPDIDDLSIIDINQVKKKLPIPKFK